MLSIIESSEHAAKCTRNANYDHNTVCTSHIFSPSTKGLPNMQTKDTNDIDLYEEDYSTKHTCITPFRKYTAHKGNSVTLKSLASYIEERPP